MHTINASINNMWSFVSMGKHTCKHIQIYVWTCKYDALFLDLQLFTVNWIAFHFVCPYKVASSLGLTVSNDNGHSIDWWVARCVCHLAVF